LAEDEEVLAGPQDIIFTERVDRSMVKILRRAGGFITLQGGMDSPGAIVAVELGLPAVIGVEGSLGELVDGLSVVLDANTGQVSEWTK
jgi:phosphohistidine swiveling domain-containing protein